MNNEIDYSYIEDDGSDEYLEANDNGAGWHAQEMLEQEQWEKDNDVKSLLDNDPGYHRWADELDRQANEDREILAMAEIEAERNFDVLTPWD